MFEHRWECFLSGQMINISTVPWETNKSAINGGLCESFVIHPHRQEMADRELLTYTEAGNDSTNP